MYFKETLEHLELKIESGCPEALFQLAQYHYENKLNYDIGSYDVAYEMAYDSALHGNPRAERLLPLISHEIGYEYKTGMCRDKNEKMAEEYFQIGHDYGLVKSTLELARLHANKPDSEKCLSLSVKLYTIAAETYNASACYELAMLYRERMHFTQGSNIVIELLKNASAGGHSGAHYELGFLYYYGIGVEKDIGIGLFLMEKACARFHNAKALKFIKQAQVIANKRQLSK